MGLGTLATVNGGTGVATFLATPTSANLRSAITDPTGTGANVFAISPTLTTPTIVAIDNSALFSSLQVRSGALTSQGILQIRNTSNSRNSVIHFTDNAGGIQASVGYGNASSTTYASTFYFNSLGRNIVISSSADNTTHFFMSATTGNIGLGTNTPSDKSILDLTSTTRGFLSPRMTTAQRDAITSVPAGLMIYNTSTNKLNFYNGSAWEAVTSA
jgi:hypothetical protein